MANELSDVENSKVSLLFIYNLRHLLGNDIFMLPTPPSPYHGPFVPQDLTILRHAQRLPSG